MIDPQTVRRLALALPEAEEHDHQGRPSFRVRGKIFATLWAQEQRAVVKLAIPDQAALTALAPAAFAPVPGTWGHQGWTNVDLATVEHDLLQQTLVTAWRHVAPKRLANAYAL